MRVPKKYKLTFIKFYECMFKVSLHEKKKKPKDVINNETVHVSKDGQLEGVVFDMDKIKICYNINGYSPNTIINTVTMQVLNEHSIKRLNVENWINYTTNNDWRRYIFFYKKISSPCTPLKSHSALDIKTSNSDNHQ